LLLSLKRWDAPLLALLLLLSFLPLLALGGEGRLVAEVTVAGELKERAELTGEPRRIEIETEQGTNVLVVGGGVAAFVEADCPDHICVKVGELTREGESAACLPHKVLLEIKRVK